VIAANMRDELPFMATEDVIMRGTAAGASRQALHEAVRTASLAAVAGMKQGAGNDLVTRMLADPALAPHVSPGAIDPRRYVGRAPEQVGEFLGETLEPLLATHAERRGRFVPGVRV
jgi:adenylosuccinate lyase